MTVVVGGVGVFTGPRGGVGVVAASWRLLGLLAAAGSELATPSLMLASLASKLLAASAASCPRLKDPMAAWPIFGNGFSSNRLLPPSQGVPPTMETGGVGVKGRPTFAARACAPLTAPMTETGGVGVMGRPAASAEMPVFACPSGTPKVADPSPPSLQTAQASLEAPLAVWSTVSLACGRAPTLAPLTRPSATGLAALVKVQVEVESAAAGPASRRPTHSWRSLPAMPSDSPRSQEPTSDMMQVPIGDSDPLRAL
mmetsp:Transcript_96546/g.311786  ORF Transcript_96546/g.311786 Transcript_96546/m.311786 type:complete len:255 (-) Transcript_96546:831-1595(-)